VIALLRIVFFSEKKKWDINSRTLVIADRAAATHTTANIRSPLRAEIVYCLVRVLMRLDRCSYSSVAVIVNAKYAINEI
jgi:hypothetical protein